MTTATEFETMTDSQQTYVRSIGRLTADILASREQFQPTEDQVADAVELATKEMDDFLSELAQQNTARSRWARKFYAHCVWNGVRGDASNVTAAKSLLDDESPEDREEIADAIRWVARH